MFVVPADCWGIPRPASRSTCSQTAGQSEHFGFSASFPGTLCSEEPRIGLPGLPSSLSLELTRECPLKCPGCYAYDDAHLGGGHTLRDLNDQRGESLVDGVLEVVVRLKPLHLSIVGGGS